MEAWGFEYKSNIIWHKLRKDGGSDGGGVGFYFRNVTEMILFGVRGKNARTLSPGRRQVNVCKLRFKREGHQIKMPYNVEATRIMKPMAVRPSTI